ncbi:MAG TPA: GNAT family N-acetyltransferase [Acidimicrobiia bacterium]|nr:GNAT family N-acetyltransferase [Acidimicrobiia bacterium]
MTGAVSRPDPPRAPAEAGGDDRDEKGEVAEPETIERRGERARLASWRADGQVAHLSPTAMRPLSADFIGSCVERLRARGFTSVVTSALSEAECTGFLRAGFDVQEELELLAHDLDAIPERRHHLRKPRRGDRPQVLAVDAAAFNSFWRLHQGGLEDALGATPAVRFRVHGRRDRLDGYVIGGRGPGTGYVQRLAVHPASRGQGLGHSMVGDVLSWMRRHGAARALVNTQKTNEVALALYLACGFRVLPEGLRVLVRAL